MCLKGGFVMEVELMRVDELIEYRLPFTFMLKMRS
nr:MAG TPA: hypothetical protein [Caudoviricetes sp.]